MRGNKLNVFSFMFALLTVMGIMSVTVGSASVLNEANTIEVEYAKLRSRHIDLHLQKPKTLATEIEAIPEAGVVNEEKETDYEYISEIPLGSDLQEFIWKLCSEKNISPMLAYAIINKESTFRNVLSDNGRDYGLMQIRDINHASLNKRFGRELDYLNPFDNVLAGISLFSDFMDKYSDETKALMCYNMGESGASKAWKKGIYKTEYSEKVLKYKRHWQNVSAE